jgi:hypothetical protein
MHKIETIMKKKKKTLKRKAQEFIDEFYQGFKEETNTNVPQTIIKSGKGRNISKLILQSITFQYYPDTKTK